MGDVELRFYEILIREEIENLCENGRFLQMASYIQHGDISVFEHSVGVAYMSVFIARSLHVKLHHMVLIRGALLHDYFLYDWHEKDRRHCLHGLRHPRLAMRNACEDYELTKREKNIILRHMFPLTVVQHAGRKLKFACLDIICDVFGGTALVKTKVQRIFSNGVERVIYEVKIYFLLGRQKKEKLSAQKGIFVWR